MPPPDSRCWPQQNSDPGRMQDDEEEEEEEERQVYQASQTGPMRCGAKSSAGSVQRAAQLHGQRVEATQVRNAH